MVRGGLQFGAAQSGAIGLARITEDNQVPWLETPVIITTTDLRTGQAAVTATGDICGKFYRSALS